jgi:dihydrolipoamide dehydrogenase
VAETRNVHDLAVIGAGPGGYVAAIRAAQLGLKTVVIEKDRPGGICLNWGCIPTKALLRSAEVFSLIQHASEFGIQVDGARVDLPAIIKRSRKIADRLAKGVDSLFRKYQVEHLAGFGRLAGRGVVEVAAADGRKTRVNAKNVIIATGSKPRALPGLQPDGKRVVTYFETLVREEMPKSVVIVGAGAIGVEFAYFYATLGAKVTLLEALPRILPMEDSEVTAQLAEIFKKNRIVIATDCRVEGAEKDDQGVLVKFTRAGDRMTARGDFCLVAVGTEGNAAGIGLEELGAKVERGFVKVDADYRTGADGVFAIGDVKGTWLLAHVAMMEGLCVAERLAGHAHPGVDTTNIPRGIYSHPELAAIGITEDDAKKQGLDYKVGRFPLRANGRALALGEPEGMVKVIVDAKYGEVLGATILGPGATELLAEIGVARTGESTTREVLHTIHAHPTLSEAVFEAMAHALGEAVHI